MLLGIGDYENLTFSQIYCHFYIAKAGFTTMLFRHFKYIILHQLD